MSVASRLLYISWHPVTCSQLIKSADSYIRWTTWSAS